MYQTISKTILGTATALAFVASAAVAEDWRAWNIHTDGHPNTAAMDRFAELVAEKTGGEVTVEVFHGGVLGSQPDALEQVQLGAIDAGNFNLGPIGPIVKEANLVSLPFIFRSVDHMFRVMDGPAGDQVSAAMGGNGTPMAFSEVYSSLSTGVVDGAENNLPSFQSVGHFEVAGFYSLSEHLIIPECICVNTAKFNALSADMQAAVVAAAEEASIYQRELWAEQTQASREAVEAAGVQINEIADKGPFQDAMAPVYADYLAANPSMVELVELAQSTE